MNGAPSKPDKEYRAGAVRVAVWTNQRQAANGQAFDSQKVQLERTYKDLQGNFKTTHTLELNDVPKAILALEKVYEHLVLKADKNDETAQLATRLIPNGPSL